MPERTLFVPGLLAVELDRAGQYERVHGCGELQAPLFERVTDQTADEGLLVGVLRVAFSLPVDNIQVMEVRDAHIPLWLTESQQKVLWKDVLSVLRVNEDISVGRSRIAD